MLPIPADKAFVQGVGIRAGDAPRWASLPSPPLRIAAIGNHGHNKGADTVIALIRRLASEQVQFRVAGTIDEGYRPQLEALSGDSVRLLGPYEPEHVGHILHDCHVALFASPWPETFMITLSEALHAGAVPVGPNLGAFAERVRDGENGLVVAGDVGSYVGAVLSLLDNPSRLEKLRAGALATPVPTIEEEAAAFAEVYDGLAAKYGLPGASFPVALPPAGFVPIVGAGQGVAPRRPYSAAKSTLAKVVRVYRSHGAHAVLRRAWQRTSGWIRSR